MAVSFGKVRGMSGEKQNSAANQPEKGVDALHDKVNNLESLFTHLERTVQDLDSVVNEEHDQISSIKKRVSQLEQRIEDDKEDFPEDIRELL